MLAVWGSFEYFVTPLRNPASFCFKELPVLSVSILNFLFSLHPSHSTSLLLSQELTEVEVELGRFSSLRQEVQEEERVFQVLKAQKAATRLQRERKTGQNLQLKLQHLRE